MDRSQSIVPFSLLDLIPLEELQQFQDTIAEINGVKSIIADPDGNFLTMPSNDIPLCPLIYQSPRAYTICIRNLKDLSKQMRHNKTFQPISCAPCREFGIIKGAVPIIVNEKHIANWWISQYCPERTSEAQIRNNAKKLRLDADLLIEQLAAWPQNDSAHFEKAISCIDQLVGRITLLGYQNLILSQDADKLHYVEKEFHRYKTSIEEIVHNRTAELVKTNSRMQLEALERELIEEQIERKSMLLDAINQMLQTTLAHQNDIDLATRCVRLSMTLTDSPFGFLVEYTNLEAIILAKEYKEKSRLVDSAGQQTAPFRLYGIWKQIIQNGEPIVLNEPLESSQQPKNFPSITSLLAIPMHNQQAVTGFIALANKTKEYAPIDLNDTKALVQAFSGVLHRMRMEKTSVHSEKRLKLALDSANEGLWDFLPLTAQIYFSPRWYTMLGYSMDEFPSSMETWHALTHPDDLKQLKDTFNKSTNGEEDSFRIEIRMLSQAAQWLWIQVRGSTAERDEDGRVMRIAGTMIDISKYKQVELALQKANAELQRLAALDDLTQIANRRRFDERLMQEWRRARRDHTPLALVLCDIDHFKLFNDTYGHLKGDEALYNVAQTISSILKRSMDLVARFGGEEFAVILPNTDVQGAVRVAGDIKRSIDKLNIEHSSSQVNPFITCSFGVASLIPYGDLTLKTLIDRSDKALYRAKTKGRNRIESDDDVNIQEVRVKK